MRGISILTCIVCHGEYEGQKGGKYCPFCYKEHQNKKKREKYRKLKEGVNK